MDSHVAVTLSARLMEWAGIGTMVLGTLCVGVIAVVRWKREGARGAFEAFRRNLGRAILLGLEFLVAADIIRTVSEDATLRSVAILGGIVLIRTFLSFTLEAELEGRWPWKRAEEERRRRRRKRREASGKPAPAAESGSHPVQ